MGQKSSFLEGQFLAQAFGDTAWTPPATWYVVLSTQAFDPSLTGSSVAEPGSNYSRFAVTNSSSEWTAPSGSNPTSVSNINAWGFPSANGDWGTIQSVYLADASSGGNLCFGTAVTGGGVPITQGSSFTVPAGSFLVRET